MSQKKKWAKEDDEKLLKLHEEFGQNFKLISASFPGRTVQALRQRVKTLKKMDEEEDDQKNIEDLNVKPPTVVSNIPPVPTVPSTVLSPINAPPPNNNNTTSNNNSNNTSQFTSFLSKRKAEDDLNLESIYDLEASDYIVRWEGIPPFYSIIGSEFYLLWSKVPGYKIGIELNYDRVAVTYSNSLKDFQKNEIKGTIKYTSTSFRSQVVLTEKIFVSTGEEYSSTSFFGVKFNLDFTFVKTFTLNY